MTKKTRLEKLERVLAPGDDNSGVIGLQEDNGLICVTHWQDGERVEELLSEEAFRTKYPDSFLITVIRETGETI